MNKISVLHVQHFVYPYRFPLFAKLGESLDLEVLFCREKRPWRKWKTDLPEGRNYSAVLMRAWWIGPLSFNPDLGKILKKEYDVYSVASLDRITFLQFIRVLFAAKMRGAHFVMVDEFLVTDYYRSKRRISYFANTIVRKLLYRYVDAFVLWNKVGVSFVQKLGVAPEKIFCGPQVWARVSDGFNRDSQEVNSSPVGKGKPHVSVLYVGSLIERKGVHILVRAFRGFERSDLRLVIVGTGPYERALRGLAEGDPRIVFRGHLEGREKWEAFRDADVFVLPSLHEPWGFVVNEALEWGLPVIATSAVGSADYLVQDNGVIVPPGDPVALYEALVRVLDGEEIRTMGAASMRLSSGMGIDDMARPFLSAVDFLITGGQAGTAAESSSKDGGDLREL